MQTETGAAVAAAEQVHAEEASIADHQQGLTKSKFSLGRSRRPPVLLALRSSTAVLSWTVGIGLLVDLAAYSLVVPVVPFRLAELGYQEHEIGSLTGWLVAAYAGALIASSPPIAYVGHRIKNRKWPLVFFLLFMAAGLIVFMLSDNYAGLVIGRILQGISGTGVWTIGLCLITDSVPEERVGVVMGMALVGFSVGQLIGPVAGGSLYHAYGFRAPTYFGLALVAIDLLLRLLMVEKKDAAYWISQGVEIKNFEAPAELMAAVALDKSATEAEAQKGAVKELSDGDVPAGEEEATAAKKVPAPVAAPAPSPRVEGRWQDGLWSMVTSGRPLTLFGLTMINGWILGGNLDTGLTIYLNYRYGINSLGAGLVFIAFVAPAFVVSPLAGWASDRWGARGVATIGVIVSIPAYALFNIIAVPLPVLCFFGVLCGSSLAAFLAPTTQDLSVVVAETPGLGPSSAFSCFNMCYSIGSFIGPIAAGQILKVLGTRNGWICLCSVSAGLSALALPFVYIYVGGKKIPSFGKRKQERDEQA